MESRYESISPAGDSALMGEGDLEGAFWEASNIPRLPSLSPAKTRGFEGSGWKPREYMRSGTILIPNVCQEVSQDTSNNPMLYYLVPSRRTVPFRSSSLSMPSIPCPMFL